MAGSGSLSCHGPTPDTQNSPRAFLALSPSISFPPTRVLLQLSFRRPDCILYCFPLFLLSLSCRPLSDTFISECFIALCPCRGGPLGSLQTSKKNIAHSPCSWLRKYGAWLSVFSIAPPVLSLTFECPLLFFHLLLLSFSPSALAVSMFLWRQCCKGA